MPARDGTGSMEVGSRTRRRLGHRGRPADEATAAADPYRDCGLGWGSWPRAGATGPGAAAPAVVEGGAARALQGPGGGQRTLPTLSTQRSSGRPSSGDGCKH